MFRLRLLSLQTKHDLCIYLMNDHADCCYCCDRKSPSGMCAKLRTVAASNNRDHVSQSLYYYLFAPHICGVVLRAHPVRGESHNHRNANREVATASRNCVALSLTHCSVFCISETVVYGYGNFAILIQSETFS